MSDKSSSSADVGAQLGGEDAWGEEEGLIGESAVSLSYSLSDEYEDVVDALVLAIKDVTTLPGIEDSDWNTSAERVIEKFIKDHQAPILTIYYTPEGLTAKLGVPEWNFSSAQYFYRIRFGEMLTEENLFDVIGYGTLGRFKEQSIYLMGCTMYPPLVEFMKKEPKYVREKVLQEATEFLLTYGELFFSSLGLTGIHIPIEACRYSVDRASKSPTLVSRFNTVIVKWYSHINASIKEIHTCSFSSTNEPHHKYEFWQLRYLDLCGIWEQLEQCEVGHICRVLVAARSHYIDKFFSVLKPLKKAIEQAHSNTKFLSLLVQPCTLLGESKGVDAVPELVPRILFILKFIWARSKHYNDDQDLLEQCMALSNLVIRKCMESINLEGIFSGKPSMGKKMFLEIIQCCNDYRRIYDTAVALHNEHHFKPWTINANKVFSKVDSLKQRAVDMVEVCDAYQVFGRMEDDGEVERPNFGWTRAQEFDTYIDMAEKRFAQSFSEIRKSQGSLLDLHTNNWPKHIAEFREGLRVAEIIIENLMDNIFETVRNVEEGLEVLQLLYRYSKQTHLYHLFERRTLFVQEIFVKELEEAKKELIAGKYTRFKSTPKFGGRAMVAHQKKTRLRSLYKMFEEAEWLPETPLTTELKEKYHKLLDHLNDVIDTLYFDWVNGIPQDFEKRSERPLMAYARQSNCGLLAINIERTLLNVADETRFWLQMDKMIPPHIHRYFNSRYDEIHSLYKNIKSLVGEYNKILLSLSYSEKLLFKEHLLATHNHVMPGLNSLFWSNPLSNAFFKEAFAFVSSVGDFVRIYKVSNSHIRKLCEEIACWNVVEFPLNVEYNMDDFIKFVKNSLKVSKTTLGEKLTTITDYIRVIFDGFTGVVRKVRPHWVKYIDCLDNLVELALILCARKSLKHFYNTLKGGSEERRALMINVTMNIKNKNISFNPMLLRIGSVMKGIFMDYVMFFFDFPRILDSFNIQLKIKKPRVSGMIAGDRECQKCVWDIEEEIANTYSELDRYVQTWTKYRHIWEIDRDVFLSRYKNRDPPIIAFSKDINRYYDLAKEVYDLPSSAFVGFLSVNAYGLKLKIIGECEIWSKRLTNILMFSINNHIEGVYKYCHELTQRISDPPKDLAELRFSLFLSAELKNDVPLQEMRFPKIKDQINLLEWFYGDAPPEITARFNGIAERWETYKKELESSHAMIMIKRAQFHANLHAQIAEFKQSNNRLQKLFFEKAPYTGDDSKRALKILNKFIAEIVKARKKEESLREDLKTFNEELEPSPVLESIEKDINQLLVIWTIGNNWDKFFAVAKETPVATADSVDMDIRATETYKKLTVLMKDLRDRNWSCIEQLRKKVDLFRKAIPLISDLQNKDLKKRHWDQIRDITKTKIDETSPKFTVGALINLKLQEYADSIKEISYAATVEYSMEKQLATISEAWSRIKLDMVKGKDKAPLRLVGCDNIFATLEEHQNMLSSMKSSRFVQPFLEQINYWETNLTVVLEVLEQALSVQKNFVYFENIFSGEDIRKQLPKEGDIFDKITREWRFITKNMNKANNAFIACQVPGLLKTLKMLFIGLEAIYKALEKYLETKRHIFPRFYFISNDDLLEILGNFKSPEKVQPHFKKCFDNINKIKMQKHAISNRLEGFGMYSAEGEYVDFSKSVPLEGPVELWMVQIEKMMRISVRDQLKVTRAELKKKLDRRDKWVKDFQGQMCITSSQIQWTFDCTKALVYCKQIQKGTPLKKLKEKHDIILAMFSDAIRAHLTKLQRLKVVALVTIEVHARDVIDNMYHSGARDVQAFEWLAQLRFYWDRDSDDCIVRQTNTYFVYGYEYLGNSGRLVITPLTDRCYITLTTALYLYRGGSPKGPAGTGKTETVKDLGKALAYYVIVINCSEGLDYKSMGRMFSGFAQSGAWGCFDEFNRINIEVLSVVAQQILSILAALAAQKTYFTFEGVVIRLVPTCGIFVTMNPGYAGRTELPDNLKSMFRPISMMVPDSMLIAEITLFGEGFRDTRNLAKKVYTLFNLARQQLSKQDHYDFGLRGMVSLLRYAGKTRRQYPELPDEQIVLLAMRDMNLAKLTSDDLPLFNGIARDLFPNVELPVVEFYVLSDAVKDQMLQWDLMEIKAGLSKVIQLYQTKESRHSVVILGASGAAKSTTWKLLKHALSYLKRDGVPGYESVQEYAINPKALSLAELYGEFNLAKGEWCDGVLSSIMRRTCADESLSEKWILFDGPVDAVWIENMNSVMDDNKILTLINSERITMPEQVSLLFEVEDLSEASPATVSRCGVVFNDYKDFGWIPYTRQWLTKQKNDTYRDLMERYFSQYVKLMLQFKTHACVETVTVPEISSVSMLCKLLTCIATPEDCLTTDKKDNETMAKLSQLWFLFCLVWSIGASVNEEGRERINLFLRELEPDVYPKEDTVYEYLVSPENLGMIHWSSMLPENWTMDKDLPFFKIFVPTIDTLRYEFLTSKLLLAGNPVLIAGIVGTGKTSTANNVLRKLDPQKYTSLTLNMSAQTTSNIIQDTIESRVEKRTKTNYIPIGGKNMVTFMDDFNMPIKERFGAQPALELIRQWIDYGFWYNRTTQNVIAVKDMAIIAAMGPPGGGRNSISNRLLTKFCVLNMTFPIDSQILRIFQTMLDQHVEEFVGEVKEIVRDLTLMTLVLYKNVATKMLPTPTKTHYLFNLRDISKVFQGLLRSTTDMTNSRRSMLELWTHECFRVFSDRLVDDIDRHWLHEEINFQLVSLFGVNSDSLLGGGDVAIFCSFLNQYQLYECVKDLRILRNKIESEIKEYNSAPGNIRIDLVLFKQIIENICHLSRVISETKGHALVVGIGGCGRQYAARMAAWLLENALYKIDITQNYKVPDFKDDLRKIYYSAGVKDMPTVFLFTDSQIADEGFLEIINNILSTGEVTKLYRTEEFEEIKKVLFDSARRAGIPTSHEELYNFFLDKLRANLHLILCMSPVSDIFRTRLRQYPALVSCTTIKWLSDWPQEAFLEVALRYLHDIDFETYKFDLKTVNIIPDRESVVSSVSEVEGGLAEEQEKIEDEEELDMAAKEEARRLCVAKIFASIHVSVQRYSNIMLKEMKRHNYVTPVNYLELVAGYKKMLRMKRIEIGSAANKLQNGLSKIDETKDRVHELAQELEVKTEQVKTMSIECDEYLIVILNQKKEANLTQKSVALHSEKILLEEQQCKMLADLALGDLQEAMPALEAAMLALQALNKKDVAEVRSYGKPPAKVLMVLEAVMILKGVEPTWAEAKRELGDVNFLQKLKDFDKDHIPEKTLRKVTKYVKLDDFDPEKVGMVSVAAKSLAMWVIAIQRYGGAYKVVAPRRAKLEEAMAALKEKQESLQRAKDKMDELTATVMRLEEEHAEKLKLKNSLEEEAEQLRLKLERAADLVDNLSGERIRWETTVFECQVQIKNLPADCLLATAFMAYVGPFDSIYRDALMEGWMESIRAEHLSFTQDYNQISFLEKPHVIRMWNKKGLPTDSFSCENGIIIQKSYKWPLVIDPQSQAWKWIKNMETARDPTGLKILDFSTPNYIKIIERAMRKGTVILLQNVTETLDADLLPVLDKILVEKGGDVFIKVGDNLLDFHHQFRLYITTKLSNPHYLPDIVTRTSLINFAIKEEGLQAQLLGIVVGKEKPKLERDKDNMVTYIANGKELLLELENDLLRMLSEAKGSLLDDDELFETLRTSRHTANSVNEQLLQSIETEKAIDIAREAYRDCAVRASLLFFVLKDLSSIDPMYQFSLDSYIDLFEMSIRKSGRSEVVSERITILNDYHTEKVYTNTCRGLFEDHKLLFSFLICVKIQELKGKIRKVEFNFLLQGGVVLNRDLIPSNPCKSWLRDEGWDNIYELDKINGLTGIVKSFQENQKGWKNWYYNSEPELARLIDDWEDKCTDFQRLLILRCIRKDRLFFAITTYIQKFMGYEFIASTVLDVGRILDDSTSKTPLIFVLSPGVDPTNLLVNLAEAAKMSKRFYSLSLGQGQAPTATKMIEEGMLTGQWVFLANCHLSLSWMPDLDKIIENLQFNEDVHKDFRLWLSSSPHPDFPISILQNSLKMTTEPPRGLRANMLRLYNMISEEKLHSCSAISKFKKLVFSLCWFHSIILERKKFAQLGWNVIYSFNDADFEVSLNILSIYLDEYDLTPWEALKYLIAGICYGGHVTDEWDRRLLLTYIDNYFNDNALSAENYRLSPLEHYFIPPDGGTSQYKEFVSAFPFMDPPQAFGQHPNADITSLIIQSNRMCSTLMKLQIQDVTDESGKEMKVLALAADVLHKVPNTIDYNSVETRLGSEKSPLDVVLLQEISRYNTILHSITTSLDNLQNAIRGFVVMSSDLEEIFQCIYEGRVPMNWLKGYPSLLNLGSWTRDLMTRVDHFAKWALELQPPILFWLSAFTFPTGFLTAVLQISARGAGISVDTLGWEFIPQRTADFESPPDEGAYVRGMYLEGASWNKKRLCLKEPNLMELVCPLPVIHFLPVEQARFKRKVHYNCPVYYYPQRSGMADKMSYIVTVVLKSGSHKSEHWVKRGTAILLSLSN